MKEVVLWGATGQAKVIHEALLGTDARIIAIVDNRVLITPIPGVEILQGSAGLDKWLNARPKEVLWACVAVGGDNGKDRVALLDLLVSHGMKPLTVIHRTAFVAADATVGDGCQVLAQAAICTRAQIGRSVIVNTAASVDHDGIVGDGAHLAPGARIAGEARISARAFIGTGAIVLPRIQIGEDAIVGAGAVVTKDVASSTVVAGNPARFLRHR